WRDLTQIDWVIRKSQHQVFLLDQGQGVRPIDVPSSALAELRANAGRGQRNYRLRSQMRVAAGDDYLAFVRELLSGMPPEVGRDFGDYDLRFYDDLPTMRDASRARNGEHGLARLVAGYAWPWLSKGKPPDSGVYDVEIDGVKLCWNRTATDWINSS